MTILKTSPHNKYWLLAAAFLCSTHAWAADLDFACLKALIPATQFYGVQKNRNPRYAIPRMSDNGEALEIGVWKNHHLSEIYVYTEKVAKRFDRYANEEGGTGQSLTQAEPEWLEKHVLMTRLESLATFRIHPEQPAKIEKWLPSHDVPEYGGWLVQAEDAGDLKKPIRAEIDLREGWARNHNLDAAHFKSWTKAHKICSKRDQ
jgi:hypothetical protein